jgi:hypothetical protein
MEKRDRLGTFQAVLLNATAIIIDALQLVLGLMIIGFVLNTLITVMAWLSYFLWYKLLDISFIDAGLRKAVLFMGTGLIEVIPFINGIPTWTLSVILMILIVRHEDARYNKERKDSVQKMTATV